MLAASATRVGCIRPTLSQAPLLPVTTRPTPRSPQATAPLGWGRARQHAHACRTRRRAGAPGGARAVPPPDHARVGQAVLLAVHGRGAGSQRSGGADPAGVGGDSGSTAGPNRAGVPVSRCFQLTATFASIPPGSAHLPAAARRANDLQGLAEIEPLPDASLPGSMVFPQLPPPNRSPPTGFCRDPCPACR